MYKHSSGIILRLIKTRKSNINTYIIVDELNVPVLKKSYYSSEMKQQRRLVTGFDKLIEL